MTDVAKQVDGAPNRAAFPFGTRRRAMPAGQADRAAARPAAPAGRRGEPVVVVRGLSYTYPDGTRVDYGDLPFTVHPRERVVLLGPNGAGKSTLLLHVLGLLEAQRGEARVFGRPAHKLASHERAQLAALLQQVDEQIIGPTVWDDVAFTPRNLGLRLADVERLVEAALRRLDIWHLRRKVAHSLSAGEKRKVALAAAIVFSAGSEFGPRLIVLDEPFAALDPRSRTLLMGIVDELRRDHDAAFLISTHFVHAVPEFADTVYVLAPGGRIAASGTPEEVFAQPEVLEALDIEPPVLSQLFRSLEKRGISLPPPLSVEHAAELLASHCRPGGRRLPDSSRSR